MCTQHCAEISYNCIHLIMGLTTITKTSSGTNKDSHRQTKRKTTHIDFLWSSTWQMRFSTLHYLHKYSSWTWLSLYYLLNMIEKNLKYEICPSYPINKTAATCMPCSHVCVRVYICCACVSSFWLFLPWVWIVSSITFNMTACFDCSLSKCVRELTAIHFTMYCMSTLFYHRIPLYFAYATAVFCCGCLDFRLSLIYTSFIVYLYGSARGKNLLYCVTVSHLINCKLPRRYFSISRAFVSVVTKKACKFVLNIVNTIFTLFCCCCS